MPDEDLMVCSQEVGGEGRGWGKGTACGSVTDSRRLSGNTKHKGFRCEGLDARGSVVTLMGTPNVLSTHATQGGSYRAE